MKNLLLILSILFDAITILGAIYVLLNNGTVSAGFAVIPMLITMALLSFWRNIYKKK